jgi:hypothetical protein
MCKMFIRRFVASILGLLIASSMLLTNGQSQSGILSDENEAEIIESLIQSEIKPLGSEFGNIRVFSSDNIGLVSATRIAKHGFSLMAPREIERLKEEYVVDYVVIRSISLRNGIVVVRLSIVTEGRACFAVLFPSERSFIYWYKKNPTGWVGKLVKRPEPFPFTRSWATTP